MCPTSRNGQDDATRKLADGTTKAGKGWMIGNYQILRELGRGGMGVVYKAYEESLNRVVALKVLPPAVTADPVAAKRFRREARAMAALNHPNIVNVHGVGEADGQHFIAMEYVSGCSLDKLIAKEGCLEPQRAVQLILQAAEALSYAHKRGIVHRDLKPSNIMLEDNLDRVKVTDFGIATILGDIASVVTAEGATLGTPAYMSPEQVLNKAIDQRTDVYSLGVVLYQLLCGQLPYGADSPLAIMRLIADAEPKRFPIGVQRVPKALIQTVEKAIAKDRSQRFSDMDELIEGLSPRPGQTDVPQVTTHRRLVPRMVLAGLLTAAFLALLWWAWPFGGIGGTQKVWIEDVPPAEGDGNGYVRGLEVLLAHAGTPVAYDRLMGLSGMAFIAQADTEHRWEGTLDEAGDRWKGTLDVGWWPLDAWGLQLRRDFLGRAIGYDLQEVGWLTLTSQEVVAILPKVQGVYREHIEPHVRRSIDAGQPVLSTNDFGFVIFGYDDAVEEPAVLGRCGRDTTTEVYRPEHWPNGLLVLGRRTEEMDTDAADLAALQYAVDLAHDRAGPDDPRWRGRRFTGRKAFAAWAAVLRDPEERVEGRHHANMRGNLHLNRTAAVTYLRNVAGRRDGEAAEALRRAATSYESVLTQLEQIDCTGLGDDLEARRKLADQVDRIAETELEAAGHIQTALAAE